MSDYDPIRLPPDTDYNSILVRLAVVSLWIELDCRARAKANSGSIGSSDAHKEAGSELQLEIKEDYSALDMSLELPEEEEALAPAP
jgi:hypothetical protein